MPLQGPELFKVANFRHSSTTVLVFVLVSCLLIPAAHGQDLRVFGLNPGMNQEPEFQFKPDEIIAPQLIVQQPWSIETYRKFMSSGPGENPDRASNPKINSQTTAAVGNVALTAAFLPPLVLISDLYFRLAGRDSDDTSRLIVQRCRSHLKTVEGQISCVMQQIFDYTMALPKFKNGITFDARTACALAARLFEKSFRALEIPNSGVGYRNGSVYIPSLHVVSTFTLTDEYGRTFGYVVDIARPRFIFPASFDAKAYHDPGQTGQTTITEFPDLDFRHPRSKLRKR